MDDSNDRKKLLDLIDRKAFDPVLNAEPKKFPEHEREKLKNVQSKTRSTKERYHNSYSSAEEVYDNYKDDLSSKAAQRVHDMLRDLDLPTLNGIEGEVDALAKDLGLKG